jgi:hypothetical protein
MSVQRDQARGYELEPGAPQFSIGSMLAATAVVAVTCSLFFSMPNGVATPALILITLALPCVLTTIAIYGRGYQRTFCIGALFPAGAMLVCTSLMLLIHSISAYQNSVSQWKTFVDKVGPYYRPYVGGAWVSSLLFGLLAVVVRLLTEQGRRR